MTLVDDIVILDSRWYPECGIVRVQTKFDGIRYYIRGTFQGNSQTDDELLVWRYGNTFPKAAGDVLFGIKETN